MNEPISSVSRYSSVRWHGENCGRRANESHCRQWLESSTAIAAALTPMIGYERAASLAKEVLASGKTVREVLADGTDLPAGLMEQVTDPYVLTRPP